jgi:preprotein translocase subunit SecG
VSVLDKLTGPPNAADASAGGAYLVAMLFNVLPQITALLAAMWFILRLVIGWQEYRLNQRKLRGRE